MRADCRQIGVQARQGGGGCVEKTREKWISGALYAEKEVVKGQKRAAEKTWEKESVERKWRQESEEGGRPR